MRLTGDGIRRGGGGQLDEFEPRVAKRPSDPQVGREVLGIAGRGCFPLVFSFPGAFQPHAHGSQERRRVLDSVINQAPLLSPKTMKRFPDECPKRAFPHSPSSPAS